MHTQTTPYLRDFTCPLCGSVKRIEVRDVEKGVVVCAHVDTRGDVLPVIQKVDEGERVAVVEV